MFTHKMKTLLVALMCLAVFGLAGTANATPINFEIGQNNSWVIGTGWGEGPAALGYSTLTDPNLSSVSFALNVDDSYSFNFGTFTLNELDGTGSGNPPSISGGEQDNVNGLTVTAVLDFDLPAGVHLVNNPGNAVAITGNIADYVAAHCSDGSNATQAECTAPNTNTWIAAVAAHCSDGSNKNHNQCTNAALTWIDAVPAHCSDGSNKNQNQCTAQNTNTWINATSEQEDLHITFDPVQVQFSNGGQFTVNLSDPIFMTNGTQTVTATVTLNTAPTPDGDILPGGDNGTNPGDPITTPEPSTFLLLGAGLLGVGLARKRMKQ